MCGCITALILVLVIIVFAVWLVLQCAGGMADGFMSGAEWFVQTLNAVLNGEQISFEAMFAFIFIIVFFIVVVIVLFKKCNKFLRR